MTDLAAARAVIEGAWEHRANLDAHGEIQRVRAAVDAALDALEAGTLRAAEPGPDGWTVNVWAKQAILLAFRLYPMRVFGAGTGGLAHSFDKLPMKTAAWGEAEFQAAGFRAVPPTAVRRGAYVAPGAVLMPCYVNAGAYIGEGTMIDTWSTVASCAQVGKNCHISGGVGIGGVLEPLQASPVIIEDDVFIGARSEVAEGVIVREGAVLAMGVFIAGSTKIVDRATGEILYGEVPPYAVVVPGALPDPNGGPSLACAVIVKRVDARTRAKTGVNELLRD